MKKHEKIIDLIVTAIMIIVISCSMGFLIFIWYGKIWGLVALIVGLIVSTILFYGALKLKEYNKQFVYCPDCQGIGKILEICFHCQGNGIMKKETQEITRTSD